MFNIWVSVLYSVGPNISEKILQAILVEGPSPSKNIFEVVVLEKFFSQIEKSLQTTYQFFYTGYNNQFVSFGQKNFILFKIFMASSQQVLCVENLVTGLLIALAVDDTLLTIS